MNSPTWTVLTPPWDLFKPTAFYSHAKVKIRLSQSIYIQWNTTLIQMPLPEIMRQPREWQPSLIAVEAGWDQQAPDFKFELHQTSLRPCHLERSWRCSLQARQHELPSVLGGKSVSWSILTILKAGLTCQGPQLLRPAVGWQGEES